MITEDEFKEYIYSDHVPTEKLPNGSVCFESVGIYWFKTSELLPNGYDENSENPVFCYGAYLDDNGECFVRDDLRYNTDDKVWEWLFEAGYDYWEETEAPDYWAYQFMPTGPAVL